MKKVLNFINLMAIFSFLAVFTSYQTTALVIKPMLVREDIPDILKLAFQVINTYNPFNNMSMTVFTLILVFSGIAYLATSELSKQALKIGVKVS